MVQHLLLIMVAPPLLVSGRPVTLLLHATRNPVHTRVKRTVRSRVVSGLTRAPVVSGLYALVVAVTHLTPVFGRYLLLLGTMPVDTVARPASTPTTRRWPR
jgi:cytochrome c oxidase assembly factor CtaG